MTAERRPQTEDHPGRLEEADLVVRLLRAAPAKRLVQRAGSEEICYAKGHQAYPLLHIASIPDARRD